MSIASSLSHCRDPSSKLVFNRIKYKIRAMLSSIQRCFGACSRDRAGEGDGKQRQKVSSSILASPLLKSCGITSADVDANLDDYIDVSNHMCANLGINTSRMSEAEAARIYQYYLPVYVWCEEQRKEHVRRRGSGKRAPLVLGISAPQGCGKSTLCEQLESLFEYKGLRAASVSIDDFYLTREDHVKMSGKHAGNRILETRGNAGTHDVKLGTKTLRALKAGDSGTIALPRYDKSAFQGKGDRADPTTWPTVEGPVDVVLFEGWMLGFAPVPDKEAARVDPDLEVVNGFLKAYKNAWDQYCDSWLIIKVANPEFSHKWRLEAEKRMRAAGKPAMTDEEVEAFVDRFMPAYKCYLPGLYTNGPTTAQVKDRNVLTVAVDASRSPMTEQE